MHAAFGNVTIRVGLSMHSCAPTGQHELSKRVTIPYAACIQLYPPEDEHLRLETCRGKLYFLNK